MAIRVNSEHKIKAAAPASATVGVASAQVAAANELRTSIMFANLSKKKISLGIGFPAVLNSGITLQAGDVFYMDDRSVAEEAINAIAEVAASVLSVQEWSIS